MLVDIEGGAEYGAECSVEDSVEHGAEVEAGETTSSEPGMLFTPPSENWTTELFTP